MSSSPMYIFADDTKCAKHIQSAEDSVLLQNDLDSLCLNEPSL